MTKSVTRLSTAQYQALEKGLLTYCATTVFTYAGQSYTTSQVLALIAALLNVKIAVAPAKATWLAAVQAADEAEAADGEIVRGIRDLIALMFKNAPATLAALDIAPRKPRAPLSAEERVAANAKMAATRKARGITGKKQKALVTGNVTGVTIVPITSTATAPAATGPVVPPVGQTGTGGAPHS